MSRVEDELREAREASPEDRRTLAALRAGNEAAFRELVERYHGSMVRVAQMFVSNRSVAEEVVQESWLGVLNGLDRFEGRSSLKTWIFRIVANIAKTRAQREGRTLPFSALEDPARVPEAAVEPERFLDTEHPRRPGHWASFPRSWHDVPEQRLLAAETRTLIETAIEALPATQRAVITLRDVQGWDSDEVCNALGVSETNQRVLLHRARSKVRQALETYLEEEAG
jgi:RNA polymerase sigma-70 factor (ECF subfamily)